jgi:hypothetical protein
MRRSHVTRRTRDRKVISAYTGHQGVAMAQNLLVEGVAAIRPGRRRDRSGPDSRRRDAGRLGQVALLAGSGAAIVSLIQCGLGLLEAAGGFGLARSVDATYARLIGSLDAVFAIWARQSQTDRDV